MTEIIVAIIGFAGVVAAAVIAVVASNKRLEKKFDKIAEHDKEQYLAILRLTITADHVPVSERIIAGDKYIKLGGNGDVKAYYEQFLKDHLKQQEEE
ncbi:MAG: hypothetical protein II306_06000 [Clostridia bacterium]|nr:hypothetical protein [Clostridia bacterium]